MLNLVLSGVYIVAQRANRYTISYRDCDIIRFYWLLCVTVSISPPNDPSKKLAGCLPSSCCPWDSQVSKHASVLMLPALPPHPQRVCGPPAMIFASAGDVPPPSLVVPSLGTTNDIGGMTAAASVALLVKSVNFIILTLVVPSVYSAVQQQ